MENPIFRKKSMERISSPEQLNDYIKVTNPGICIVLSAVLALLIGFIVWGIVGKLENKINAVAVSEEGTVVCYVREAEIGGVTEGDTVRIRGEEYKVKAISGDPVAVDDGFTAYALRVGGLSVGEWVFRVTLDASLSEGVYEASIVTDTVSPIRYLFN